VGAGDEAVANDHQRPFEVLQDRPLLGLFVVTLGMKERHNFVQDRRNFRSCQVLGEGQRWPEYDVAVGIAGPDIPFPFEEHEPLRPVAVGVLRLEHTNQQIA
jgi:hypothetical protein